MRLAVLSSPRAVDFTHAGDYREREDDRPIITVEFATLNRDGTLLGVLETGVTVDSGAAMTFLGIAAAAKLGLDLSDPRYARFSATGAVPGGRPCAEASIMARLWERWLTVPVGFALDMQPVRPLLGRHGVFDNVLFAFPHAAQSAMRAAREAIALSPREPLTES